MSVSVSVCLCIFVCTGGRKQPYTIGLAFSAQLFEELPMDEHDIQLDHVIFPSFW